MNGVTDSYLDDSDRPDADPEPEDTLEECPFCGAYLDYVSGYLVCGRCELSWPDLAALEPDRRTAEDLNEYLTRQP